MSTTDLNSKKPQLQTPTGRDIPCTPKQKVQELYYSSMRKEYFPLAQKQAQPIEIPQLIQGEETITWTPTFLQLTFISLLLMTLLLHLALKGRWDTAWYLNHWFQDSMRLIPVHQSIACVVHMNVHHVVECREWESTPCNKSPKRARGPREGSVFVQKHMYLRFPALSVATLILANDLLQGVTDR